MYVHWNAHAPKIWKIGTLKGLIRRAFIVSSTDGSLNNEITFLRNIFTNINQYPKAVFDTTLKSFRKKWSDMNTPTSDINQGDAPTDQEADIPLHPYIILPYKGDKGYGIINDFKKTLNTFLPTNIMPRFIYKGRKLGTFFPTKDKIPDAHKSGVVYGYKIKNSNGAPYDYIGETSVRFESRIIEHMRTDTNSSIHKHSQENNYSPSINDFTIIANGYHNGLDRKLCEALYIKEYNPFLNAQRTSYKIELFK